MPRLNSLPKLVVIVGPTASGKTDLAIALAKRFDGEVISADSRQLYRGAEIGSAAAKGEWARRGRRKIYVVSGVPHHLISFLSPARALTAAEYKKLAVRKAVEIIKRGRVPILAGGTGLYVSAVADNFEIPSVPPDPILRRRLDKKSTAALSARLRRKDPVYSRKISAGNRRYLIRALEVIEKTGRPFSGQQKKGPPLFGVLKIGLAAPRREIYRRINARVDRQMKQGLLQEAKRLGRRYGWDAPALSGLGHRQLGWFLRGGISLEEAVESIKRDTRHYAKRQLTWFRRDKKIRWVKNIKEAGRLAGGFLKG